MEWQETALLELALSNDESIGREIRSSSARGF